MSTYSQLLFHIVFSTKNRKQFITPEIQPRLHDYIGGIVRGERGVLHAIGGTADHVHLLVGWHTDAALSELMRNVKSRSSRWVHETFSDEQDFQWQSGYGAFTVSQSLRGKVEVYIQSQEEHHKEKTFEEEFIGLLKAHNVDFDIQYLWR